MGLDIHINQRKRKYLYDTALEEMKSNPAYALLADLMVDESPFVILIVESEVMRWRKANQIYGWFDRALGGVENGVEYPVTLAMLQELKGVCERVLNDHDLASELLPTTEGFFFGSTAYDEWYFKDLAHTVTQIADIEASYALDCIKYGWADEPEFSYQVSY